MKKAAQLIMLALGWLSTTWGMIQSFGEVNGLIIGFALVVLPVALVFGLFISWKWRSNRLVRSMLPGETLVASGHVGERTLDDTPAILVRGTGSRYRLLVADSRGAVSVQSVTPRLKGHPKRDDPKRYIQVNTIQGLMHFAPRNSFRIAGQKAYAQRILKAMRPGGLRRAHHPSGVTDYVKVADGISEKIYKHGETNLSHPERVFWSAHLLEKVIADGGFVDLLSTPISDFLIDPVVALEEIGANESAETVRRVIALFPGGEAPGDWKAVKTWLETVDEETCETFNWLEGEFNAESDLRADLAVAYVSAHKDQLSAQG